MLLHPASSDAPVTEVNVDVVMINNDGSLAANCGNACRCITASVCRRFGLTEMDTWVRVHTFARCTPCRLLQSGPPLVEVDMGMLTDGAANDWHSSVIARVRRLCDEHNITSVRRVTTSCTGNNHVVLEMARLEEPEFCLLGQGLQVGTALDGINVHVVSPELPSLADTVAMITATGQSLPLLWRTLIWERGAGRTQACGTGACAIAHHARSGTNCTPAAAVVLPVWTAVCMPGGLLFVRACASTGRLALIGAASHLYDAVASQLL